MEKESTYIIEENSQKKSKSAAEKNIENTKINFRNGVTVYEGKQTALIAGFILTLLFAIVMYTIRSDVSDNLTTILTTFIFCIAGASTAEQAISIFKNSGFSRNTRG